MEKRIASVLILAAVMGAMLVSFGGEQEQEMVQEEADEPSENQIPTESEEIWKTWVKVEMEGKKAPAVYCDEVMNPEYTNDLSLLEESYKTDHHYACRDGRVYYRQYHEDSFEEAGLWASYDPVPGTEKEIVCVDRDGVVTEVFLDNGYGEFYLIGDRFYMTEFRECDSGRERVIYSVDMEGRDRIDYGRGEILAADEERNILIVEKYGEEVGDAHDYCLLDCGREVCMSILPEEYHAEEAERRYWDFEAYQDGWIYLSYFMRDETEKRTELYAAPVGGEWNKVITLTSNRSYSEYIIQLEAVGDRLFFLFGGWDGSAQVYQGGSMITVKRDGTDCRSLQNVSSNDRYPSSHYYLRQDGEKILVYYPCSYRITGPDGEEEEHYWVTVWDMDTGTLYPSTFPAFAIADTYGNDLFMEDNDQNNVLALPDRTGTIVNVAAHLEDSIEVLPIDSGGIKSNPQFKELYYKDGYLYFEAEYNVWSHEDSIGWRDGYRRERTEHYRLKLGEDKAELLYAY